MSPCYVELCVLTCPPDNRPASLVSRRTDRIVRTAMAKGLGLSDDDHSKCALRKSYNNSDHIRRCRPGSDDCPRIRRISQKEVMQTSHNRPLCPPQKLKLYF
jgi:hypothetical protein